MVCRPERPRLTLTGEGQPLPSILMTWREMEIMSVYGHILAAADHVSPTYWRAVTMDADAALALSRHYCGDDRASHLRTVWVKSRRDAEQLVRVALARTGRLSAVQAGRH